MTGTIKKGARKISCGQGNVAPPVKAPSKRKKDRELRGQEKCIASWGGKEGAQDPGKTAVHQIDLKQWRRNSKEGKSPPNRTVKKEASRRTERGGNRESPITREGETEKWVICKKA